tara:strand:- start:119 stop:625 length:507 start_codon:yes stop_codon:yes gene_type:complete
MRLFDYTFFRLAQRETNNSNCYESSQSIVWPQLRTTLTNLLITLETTAARLYTNSGTTGQHPNQTNLHMRTIPVVYSQKFGKKQKTKKIKTKKMSSPISSASEAALQVEIENEEYMEELRHQEHAMRAYAAYANTVRTISINTLYKMQDKTNTLSNQNQEKKNVRFKN